ncbi:MAG: VTT domain-containing protein [Gemmatimonadota bacterium]|nr:VTT domain-containing protein [Gemmatimonadota bacterium]MDH5758870.1 VTT domain-containing protein [Gemmatimonadota bacterium]
MARLLTYAWGGLILCVFVAWVARPELFSEAAITGSLARLGAWSFVGYVAVSMVRGLALVPSTPVVVAGGVLFPEALPAVLLVSMVGIVVSATILYHFPGYAGYDRWIEAKHPERVAELRIHLGEPRAQWFVALWAITPVVPTDAICYVAGLAGMPFRRMIVGLVAGELPLVTVYIFLGRHLTGFLG